MGYRRMTIEDLKSIFRRWHGGQNLSLIALSEGKDRKTIRKYLQAITEAGYKQGRPVPDKKELVVFLKTLLPVCEKEKPVRELLRRYLEEIKSLVNHEKEPVKPKTAWLILKNKYNLPGSYETYKLFLREQGFKKKKKSYIRIELPPGQEVQIDYGKAGILHNPKTGKMSAVYSFCGQLVSRFPYIEFAFKQDQASFVRSNVTMFEYYGGVTGFITLDNLKAGVITPDLYDPKINKAFEEMAEYYDVFINPCRVATATDKGKVERMVPVARELFRMLKNIHPLADLAELNTLARAWCREEYGAREHGTTGVPPLRAFEEQEKKCLKPLPAKRFEVPVWKKARVHPDQFFSFEKKRYSLPVQYKQKEVWIRKKDDIIEVFHDYLRIRTYLVPYGKSFVYEKTDFPEVLREMLEGGYPQYLLTKARVFGENAYRLVESILKPHAYLNSRRAQGVLEVLDRHKSAPLFDSVCKVALAKGIRLPKSLKQLFEEEKQQGYFNFLDIASDDQKEMIRDIEYYIN